MPNGGQGKLINYRILKNSKRNIKSLNKVTKKF